MSKLISLEFLDHWVQKPKAGCWRMRDHTEQRKTNETKPHKGKPAYQLRRVTVVIIHSIHWMSSCQLTTGLEGEAGDSRESGQNKEDHRDNLLIQKLNKGVAILSPRVLSWFTIHKNRVWKTLIINLRTFLKYCLLMLSCLVLPNNI